MTRTARPDETPPPRVAPVRGIVAAAAGLVVVVLIVAGSSSGLLRGPIAAVLLALAVVAVPSSHTAATRVAVNGAITLGVIPMLSWIPWPPSLVVGRAPLLVGLALGVVVAAAVTSPAARWRILRPRVAWADLAVPIACACSFVQLLPFFRVPPTLSSVSMLIQAFGNDNVAHFDMFEMIRRFGVAGPGWPRPADGSVYAYVPYPQHFHAFAAFLGDLWNGSAVGGVAAEVRLFGIACAVAVSIGVVVLVAAMASVPLLRRRPAVLGVAVAALVSLLLLGPGSQAMSFGFPNFLVGVLAAASALVLSVTAPVGVTRFAAMGALVVVAAHSWILLVPLAAIGPAVALLGVPWRDPAARRQVVAIAAVALVTAAASVYGAVLVLVAVRAAGSPADALATRGLVPLNQPPVTFAALAACVAVGIAVHAVARRARDQEVRGIGIAAFGVVVLLESAVLIAVQLQVAGGLDYFQHKFLDGALLCAATALVLGLSMLVVRAIDTGAAAPGRARPRVLRLPGVVVAVTLGISVITLSGLPVAPSPGLAAYRSPGAVFREKLYVEAVRTTPSIDGILHAANVMAHRPCATPIYLAYGSANRPWDQANQWAMSFSSTWTESSAPINAYLFRATGSTSPDAVISRLLHGYAMRCVVVAPATRRALSPATVDRYGARLLTWSG